MIADPKYQRLNALERSCWITLLCLASLDDGIVKHCEEQYLITHSGIDPASSDFSRVHGILVKLEMLGMIAKGRDEMGIEYIIIKNWQKRQEIRSESYERVKKWREKKALVTPVTLPSNARVDKIRIDKIRKEVTSSNVTENSQKHIKDIMEDISRGKKMPT